LLPGHAASTGSLIVVADVSTLVWRPFFQGCKKSVLIDQQTNTAPSLDSGTRQ
jgi:hypothetical protein